MKVYHAHAARLRQRGPQDLGQGVPGPTWGKAAEKEAFGVCMLPFGNGALKFGKCVLAYPSHEPLLSLLLSGLRPVRRTKIVGQLLVKRIDRQRCAEVDPISIDIHIV